MAETICFYLGSVEDTMFIPFFLLWVPTLDSHLQAHTIQVRTPPNWKEQKCTFLLLQIELRLDLRIQEHSVILLNREVACHLTFLGLNPDVYFSLTSSDVIQDMRVNVSEEEGSEEVIWYKVKKEKVQRSGTILNSFVPLSKERFLGDDEIIENLVVSIIICKFNMILENWL